MTDLEVKVGSFDIKHTPTTVDLFSGKFVVRYDSLNNSLLIYTLGFRTYTREKVPAKFNSEREGNAHFLIADYYEFPRSEILGGGEYKFDEGKLSIIESSYKFGAVPETVAKSIGNLLSEYLTQNGFPVNSTIINVDNNFDNPLNLDRWQKLGYDVK